MGRGRPTEWCTSRINFRSIVIFIFFFINDIDTGIISRLLKFAEDTKVFANVENQDNVEQLRKDLTAIYQWSVDCQMLFNLDKCKVLHFGNNNGNHEYRMGGITLESVCEELDRGVLVDVSLKISQILSGTFINITVNNTRNQKRGDLIEAFKILKNLLIVMSGLNCLQQDYEDMIINFSSNVVVLNIRMYFLVKELLMIDWNKLPPDVNSCSVNFQKQVGLLHCV